MSIADEDLIFATGAPGSRWSGYCRLISCAEEIDNSDENDARVFRHHFGNYFGPSMEHGPWFHDLHLRSREALLEEIAKPYAAAAGRGRRLIKSHHFSTHLDRMREWFPNARFVLFHRTDEECLEHWYLVGGFDIQYPRYDWYEDREGMIREIAHQNAALLKFAEERSLEWRLYDDTLPLFEELGLTRSRAKVDKVFSDLSFDTPETQARFVGRAWEGCPRVAVL